MRHLLKAVVPLRTIIVFACSVDIQMKARHDLENRLLWSYLAQDILNLENRQDITKIISFCLNEEGDSEK